MNQGAATLREVAEASGVSVSIASRALNDDMTARVSAATRARVKQVARRLEYAPSHRAQALRSSRSNALALLIPSASNAVFAELLAGVADETRTAGIAVLLAELRTPASLTELVGRGRVDGAIVQRPEGMTDARLRTLLAGDLPVVLFNSLLRGHVGTVTLDDERAARLAVKHLLDLGHRRIGYIGGTRHHDAARRRGLGFRREVRASRDPIRITHDLVAGWEADAGGAAMEQILADPRRRPTGLVVASINAGLGAASVAARHRIRIPDDMSLVCLQDTWVASVYNPPLTVVRMPLRQAGAAAVSMLLGRIGGEATRDLTLTDPAPTLMVRGSTSKPVARP